MARIDRPRIVDRQQAADTPQVEAIIDLDVANMKDVFAAAAEALPIERRRRAFAHPGTLVVVEDVEGALVGYLEYGPDFDDSEAWYISSIQIARAHRGGTNLLRLLRHALRTSRIAPGAVVKTHVQAANAPATRLVERLGFRIDQASHRKGTVSASAVSPPAFDRAKLARG